MKRENNALDKTLLFATLTLLVVGLLMVYSASAIVADQRYGTQAFFLFKQFIWAIGGLLAMHIFSRLDSAYLQKYSRLLFLVTVILLILVLFLGRSVGGARRWLRFGVFGFQPSELAKLATIIFLADYFDRKRSRLDNFVRGLLVPFVFVGIVCFLVLLEPDFGTAFFIALTSMVMFFLAGVKLRFLLGPVFLGLSLGSVFIIRAPYRLARLLSFVNGIFDLEKASYQTKEALYALGSGGLNGVGLGRGTLKLLYLPEAHTDFIFPILGEELGLLGTLGVIILFLLILWRGWKIALEIENFFDHLLASGITFFVFLQALINIGVSCGCLPTKGLPLPFISFGGSSLLCHLASIGILLHISREKKGAIWQRRLPLTR
ncbi:MAG TPA: putative lipid II flippase FtsW [Elusimicrobia bacterium]|jgi:cell division protein FtsW|nr:putative lipid II flippase FtsW [Elusimicrobiota bacterium]